MILVGLGISLSLEENNCSSIVPPPLAVILSMPPPMGFVSPLSGRTNLRPINLSKYFTVWAAFVEYRGASHWGPFGGHAAVDRFGLMKARSPQGGMIKKLMPKSSHSFLIVLAR